MKLAYIIVSHFNLEQTLRLFNSLNQKDAFFVFHVSKKCESEYYESLYAALKNHKNCLFSKRVNVIWGGFGLVQAVLNSIDTLVESNIDFDYAILLSGQDYPIKSQQDIVHTLTKNQGRQFLEFIPFRGLGELSHWVGTYHFWVGGHRFRYPHPRSDKALYTIYNLVLSFFLPKNRKLPEDIILYKGSTWWVLTRDCIDYLHKHSHSSNGKRMIKYFKNTWHSPELYIQTVLMNSAYRDQIVNNDLRFILWPEYDDGHPKILTDSDYNDIISSDRLFARKFDTKINATILDLLDEKITT